MHFVPILPRFEIVQKGVGTSVHLKDTFDAINTCLSLPLADAARGDGDAERVLGVQRVAPPRRHARRLRRRARTTVPDLSPGE